MLRVCGNLDYVYIILCGILNIVQILPCSYTCDVCVRYTYSYLIHIHALYICIYIYLAIHLPHTYSILITHRFAGGVDRENLEKSTLKMTEEEEEKRVQRFGMTSGL